MQKHEFDLLTTQNLAVTTSIESLTQGYILNCQCEGKSPQTLAIYQIVLKNFIWYCHHNCFPDEPQKINAIHVRQFLWYLASEPNRWGSNHPATRKPASPTTVNDYYRALKTFFNWLQSEELIHDNPFAHIKTPKPEKKVIQALTTEEIQRLFEVCSGKTLADVRNRAIISMFLDTGLRANELANITLDDIDMRSGSILVRHGKGGKQRVVHIGMKAQQALWRYVSIYRRSQNNRLFTSKAGKQLDADGVKTLVRRIGVKANVNVRPHKLRHTFAVSFLRAGGDVFSLQYLLGHSTLQMTQRYLQSLNADDAIKAHQKFSPLDNMGVR